MFTGIVETKGKVIAFTPNAFGARLIVDPGSFSHKPAAGDSIAVNGVCLTHAPGPGAAASAATATLAFDVIKETLQRTNLGRLAVGDAVNLEASLRGDTPIAGHFVQGHIDGVGTVVDVHDGADEWRTTIEAPPALMPCIVPKGSIAIDGVSLTIASTDAPDNRFTVALIPTTLALTTLADRKTGSTVNLETDILARTVANYLQHHLSGSAASGGVSLQKLLDAGFA